MFFISNIGFYFVTGKRHVGLFGCFFTNWTHGPLFSVVDTDRVRVITPIAHTPPPPSPPPSPQTTPLRPRRLLAWPLSTVRAEERGVRLGGRQQAPSDYRRLVEVRNPNL